MIKTSEKSRKILDKQMRRMVRNVSEDIQIAPIYNSRMDIAIFRSQCIVHIKRKLHQKNLHGKVKHKKPFLHSYSK